MANKSTIEDVSVVAEDVSAVAEDVSVVAEDVSVALATFKASIVGSSKQFKSQILGRIEEIERFLA